MDEDKDGGSSGVWLRSTVASTKSYSTDKLLCPCGWKGLFARTCHVCTNTWIHPHKHLGLVWADTSIHPRGQVASARMKNASTRMCGHHLFVQTQGSIHADVELNLSRHCLFVQMQSSVHANYLSIWWKPQQVLLEAPTTIVWGPINFVGMKFRIYDLYNYLFYLCFTFVSFSFIYFKLKNNIWIYFYIKICRQNMQN